MKKITSYLILILSIGGSICFGQRGDQPNVLLIITDDQGFGDFGFTGNTLINTPNLDQLAEESFYLTNFHVSPVCAPTRSSIMTGRYSLRTGIRDTYNGGAIMASNETTLAELFRSNGYRTGMFGKWHLGDNYPSRPIDQGFDESVIHLSGGMGQVGDVTTYFKFDSSYYNPVLWHNGHPQSYDGYCSDIFAEQAMQFVRHIDDAPFFCYLSFNAPHTPLQVPSEYYDLYKDLDFDDSISPSEMNSTEMEEARKVYAMVSNIDDNIGRLLNQLDELELRDNTIVLFMTDNGPQQLRYNAGLKGLKGSVYRGGTRVPCLLRLPGNDQPSQIHALTAHIDILPTLSDLCGLTSALDKPIDGQSWASIIFEEKPAWQERTFFNYWTRRYPELYRNLSLQKGPYRLICHSSYDADLLDLELYNVAHDPSEKRNIISENTEIAQLLKDKLDSLYQELIASSNIKEPPCIEIGSPYENPTILNRNDAAGQRGIWDQEELYGKWRTKINSGVYTFTIKFLSKPPKGGAVLLEIDGNIFRKNFDAVESDTLILNNIKLGDSKGDLYCHYAFGLKNILPFWIEAHRMD